MASQVAILAVTLPTVAAFKRENVIVHKQVVYKAANLYEACVASPVLTDECLLLGAGLASALYLIMLRKRLELHNTHVFEVFDLGIYEIIV